MARLISITALALSLTVPLWAQRGGGHGGMGGSHAGGFGGNAGMGHASGHISGGMRFGGARGFSAVSSSGFAHGPLVRDRFRGRFHTHPFRNNCFGFGCRGRFAFPWWGWSYWNPLWWWDSGSRFDDDYNRNLEIANQMNRENLEEQEMRRREEAERDQDANARRDPPQRASNEKSGTSLMPATVLVFRDQHEQEIQNYAIVGQTLWNFAPQRTEKISLAQLDLAATTKANDDRGISFRVPTVNAVQ